MQINKCILLRDFMSTDLDDKLFSLCYAPILKNDASCLYRALYSLSNVSQSQEIDGQVILHCCNLTESALEMDINILHSIGLISAKYKKKDGKIDYIIRINCCANSKKFFSDIVLTQLLKSYTSESYILKVKDMFEKEDTSEVGFDDLNIKVKDTFGSNFLNDYVDDFYDEDKLIEKNYVKAYSANMDKRALFSMLENHHIVIEAKDDEIGEILSYIMLFNLTEDQIVNVIKNSINSDNKLSIKKFKNEVTKLYKKNEDKVSFTKPIEKREDFSFVGNSQISESLNKMISYTPIELIRVLSKNQLPIDTTITNLISTLSNQYGLSMETIDVLIHYSYTKKKTLNTKYILAIARDLVIKNITKCYDVASYFYQESINKKNKNSSDLPVKNDKSSALSETSETKSTEEKEPADSVFESLKLDY